MIDMLLFYEFIYDWDAVAQDIEVVTYDLEKFYFLPWDKDTTFGLYYDGSRLGDAYNKSLLIIRSEYNLDKSKLPWIKTYFSFTKDIEERYKELRDLDVFSSNNIERLINKIDQKFTPEIRQEELKRWPDRPSVDELTKDQMIKWVNIRLEVLDEALNYVHLSR